MAAVRHIEKTQHVISLVPEELEGETRCYFVIFHYIITNILECLFCQSYNCGITNNLECLFYAFGSSLASNSKVATVRHIEHTSFLNMLLWISLFFE